MQRNSYTAAYPSIVDVVQQPNQNIVVLYGSSSDNQWQAFALQTNQIVRRRHRAVDIKTIADDTSVDFGILEDTSSGIQHGTDTNGDTSDDILRIDANTGETLVEYGIAVTTDDVYVGIENAGQKLTGLQGQPEREFGADVLDRHGVPSQLTRTDTNGVPTTALSANPDQGIIRIDSENNGRNPIRIGFYNDSGGQATPDVDVLGAAYRVTPITDTGVVEDMTYGEGYNRRVVTYGDFDSTSPNLPDDWQDGQITITDSDVQSIVSGS